MHITILENKISKIKNFKDFQKNLTESFVWLYKEQLSVHDCSHLQYDHIGIMSQCDAVKDP